MLDDMMLHTDTAMDVLNVLLGTMNKSLTAHAARVGVVQQRNSSSTIERHLGSAPRAPPTTRSDPEIDVVHLPPPLVRMPTSTP